MAKPHLYQKLAGCGGGHLYSQLLGRLRQGNHLNLEVELAVSRDDTIVRQPGKRVKLHLKKKKKKEKTQVKLIRVVRSQQW